MVQYGIMAGLVSGFFLGFLMKALENAANENIYQLLLDTKFIPVIGKIRWSEMTQFLFHLLLSAILGILYFFILNHWKIRSLQGKYVISLLMIIPLIFSYFPLTSLSSLPEPQTDNMAAFGLWAISHLLYACLLPILASFKQNN
ncbi:hypothetical protein ACN6MY_09445 [Peribacillus sp. B-H-3]|uniref:hypothetical protein n=1 Tax=Peribacillus sp. B-H-3 TaxID=3400420 RepID=UPI003B02BEB6